MKEIRGKLILCTIVILLFGCSVLYNNLETEDTIVITSRGVNSGSFSPAVSGNTTTSSSNMSLNSGKYEVNINTMNSAPDAKVYILSSRGYTVTSYSVKSNTNKYTINNLSAGTYKIQITNYKSETLYIGVILKRTGGTSGPTDPVDPVDPGYTSGSFSPAVQGYKTSTSNKISLKSGEYSISINTMNPRPNATVKILSPQGYSVASYNVRSNTNNYKVRLSSGSYIIKITNNLSETLYIGVRLSK